MGALGKTFKGVLYARGLHLGSLDGYERLIAGIYGTPDRVPIILQPYTYAMSMHGLSARKFFSEPVPFVNASSNTASYFGFDFWSPVFDFYNIELDALGQKLIWRETSEPDVDTGSPLVTSEDAFRSLRPPVAGRDGRMPYVLEAYRRYMEIMEIPPSCYCCAPFTMAVLIRGYVNFLRDMQRNPAFAHRLIDFLSMEVVAPWIVKMVEVTKSQIVVMSDAWASAPNVTTGMVREFCLPYVEKIVRATNSSARTVVDSGTWGEKDVKDPREILDIKMEMLTRGNGFASLRPLYLLVWNEDYEGLGIPLLRAYADEKKVCLMLNVRPDLLEEGPPERIIETVRGIIKEGAGEGRFAILVNLVPVGAPVDNVHAAVAAVKRFGEYPITSDLDTVCCDPPRSLPFEEWVRKEGLPV